MKIFENLILRLMLYGIPKVKIRFLSADSIVLCWNFADSSPFVAGTYEEEN